MFCFQRVRTFSRIHFEHPKVIVQIRSTFTFSGFPYTTADHTKLISCVKISKVFWKVPKDLRKFTNKHLFKNFLRIHCGHRKVAADFKKLIFFSKFCVFNVSYKPMLILDFYVLSKSHKRWQKMLEE